MTRIGKKPTLDHLRGYKSIGWGGGLARAGSTHAPPEVRDKHDHIPPLLDLCCEYVGDGPYSAAALARYAGSKASFGSYILYDDRLLDKLLATDDFFLNLGRAVNPSPGDSVGESGDRGLPERSDVVRAFMLKLLLCACELPCPDGCDTEIDGTDICGE